MEMITHQAVSIYFITTDIFVVFKFFKEIKVVSIIFKYPLLVDTSDDNMGYSGVAFLSRTSWPGITQFNITKKYFLNQHKRTVPLCLLVSHHFSFLAVWLFQLQQKDTDRGSEF